MCPDVVRAYLYQFQSLHNVLWAKCDTSKVFLEQRDLEPICNTSVKLYIHNTGKQALEIINYSATRSRYHSQRAISLQSKVVRGGRGLLSSAPEGSDTRRAELDNIIKTAQQEIAALVARTTEKQQELDACQQKSMNLRNQKNELQKGIRQPDAVRRSAENLTISIRECEAKVKRPIQQLRKSKVTEYQIAVDVSRANSVIFLFDDLMH